MDSIDKRLQLSPSPTESGSWDFVFWMVYLSSVIIDMLSALDLTAVSTSLPAIVNSLDGTDFIWVGGAYSVASAAVLPFVGNLVHTFGQKPVLIVFILAFAMGSALSGAAMSMNMLIAGRAIQGFGGGGCFSITEIIYADLVPLTERGKLQGMTAAAWALACAIGPPIGGALTQHGAWRWIFFLNIPVCAIALVLNCIFLRTETHRKRLSLKRKFSQMDLIGSSLVTGSTVLIFLATTWGGLTFPWSSPQVLSLLIIGGIGMVLFFVIERYWLKGPTIPRAFFTDRTTFGGYLGTFFHGICSIATIYYYPVYLQAAQGATSLAADVDVLPLATVIPAAAILTGLSVNISDRYRPQSFVGWAFMIVGFGLLSLLNEHSSRAMFLALQVPVTVGIGIIWISSQFAVLAPAPAASVTHALAFFTFTRTVAQGWGIVIGGAILQNVLLRELPTSFTSTLPKGVEVAYATIETISSLPEALKWEVRAAFARATQQIWFVMLGVAGAGFLSCFLLREVRMRDIGDEDTWSTFSDDVRDMSLDGYVHDGHRDSSATDGLPDSPTQEISVEAGLLR
ncbi:Mfs1.1 [Trametes versicolor FP-101664 SS1]|uniref:Mfs1.1 n=1 Tax=Trametes versicolor (strain FP-101664) TaxID=717944 RepID=UPI0004623EEF|nr:Mfs1.1 [Trametes versicolor FP-101664 SS1]EIW57860.1 Mfs1.1 [Trametes versicolor FP-101664 SS1]